MAQTRYNFIFCAAIMASVAVSSCVQTPKDTITTKRSEIDKASDDREPGLESAQSLNEIPQPADPIEYWVKKPGTLVYNEKHEIIRSLRLQPKVTLYGQNDGWGLIDPIKSEWVKLLDITIERPEGVLERPHDSNGMPRVSLKDAN